MSISEQKFQNIVDDMKKNIKWAMTTGEVPNGDWFLNIKIDKVKFRYRHKPNTIFYVSDEDLVYDLLLNFCIGEQYENVEQYMHEFGYTENDLGSIAPSWDMIQTMHEFMKTYFRFCNIEVNEELLDHFVLL